MKCLAIITARGGSKRIPKKNIKDFCGKPIIAYSIEAALNSKIFDEVIVSTDSEEIANAARIYGATVPFMRSAKNADDYATTYDVLLEVVNKYKEFGKVFGYICCIYPTAPFVTAEKLKAAFNKFIESDADTLIPVVKFSFPPQRGFVISKENYSMTKFFDDEGNLINYTYSQNIEEEIEEIDVKNGSYGSTSIENFLSSIIYESRFNKTDIIRVRVIDSALAGKDIIIVEKSTDNGLCFKNILENEDKYLIVNRDTDVSFVNEKIGFIFDLGLLGRDDRYKKFLVTTDGGESFSDVSITINGYGYLDYYYINNTPYLKKDKLVLDVSVPVENDLKDIELVSNDNALTFSN